MTFPTIVPFYAGLLGLFYIFLSLRTAFTRRDLKVSLGYGNHAKLERAVRVHGNFSEYVPFALLLLLFFELQPRPAALVHALCLILVLGRILHFAGVSKEREDFRFRTAALTCTALVILITGLSAIYTGIVTFLIPPAGPL